MRTSSRITVLLALGLVASPAPAQQASALLTHGGVWGAVTVGATSHDFRCGTCEYLTRAEAVGTSASVGAGVRVRRLVVGGMHRQWQSWFAESPSHGTTSAALAGFVVSDNDILALMPYAGIGRESFVFDTGGRTAKGVAPVLLGGGQVVVFPRLRVSGLVAFDRQGWLRGARRGALGRGYASGGTFSVGFAFH